MAVLKSENMSVGVNVLMKLLRESAGVFADAGFDVEIVEKHHRMKLDAPSGTALALADSINEAMDNEYDYELDMTKEFEEQKMSDTAKAILANIFRDYWATPYQKERIEAKEKFDLSKLEEEKREKYNPDNLFKEKKEEIMEKETADEKTNLPVEIKKETFFTKLINFIKGLFNKNN